MRITLLGTGTSTGVPMIGCHCRICRSQDPRDKRLRVSALIHHEASTMLIDTSADFRQQMLTHNVTDIDSILYTHHHYDHIAGFDDLRAFQFLEKKPPMCYATEETLQHIRTSFAYAFGGATQSGGGLPQLPFTIINEEPFDLHGLQIVPVPLYHGMLRILGFRIGSFAYLTDCSRVPEESYTLLHGVDTLILDGLRFRPHPTHFTIDQAVEHANRIGARMTYLTHMNHDVLHAETELSLPPNVRLAYDNITFECNPR